MPEHPAIAIAKRAIAEHQRKIAVSVKALRLMQEHYGNPCFSFKCVRPEEEKEWRAKAEKLIPHVEDEPCKNESRYVRDDGGCLRCDADAGVACRDPSKTA
jgi:hypothetical protein